MKPFESRSVHERIVLEPGLPPLVQHASLNTGWDTAYPLPALYELTRGLPTRRPQQHVLAGLREPGEVFVHIATKHQWPTGMQILNFSWLAHEDAALSAALLAAIYGHDADRRATYDFIPEEELPRVLPELSDPDDLLPLIRLEVITIHDVAHASTPYLGFDFACAWDDEHGLGLLTCGQEVLEIGTGEVSVDDAAAQAHRNAILERLRDSTG